MPHKFTRKCCFVSSWSFPHDKRSIDKTAASVYQAITAWDGYATASHQSLSLDASLADQCSYTEIYDVAAAERAEHQQQQAHRDLAKRLGQPATGQNATFVANIHALPSHN